MQKHPFNYWFFALFFLFLLSLSFLQLSSLLQTDFSSKGLFAMSLIGQCFLEVFLLAFLGHIIQKRAPRCVFKGFIVLVTLLAGMHFIDLILVRFLDMSVWFGIDFVMEDSVSNFLEHLYASNISLLKWGLLGVALVLLSLAGLALYSLTEKVARKKELSVSLPLQLLSIGTLACALFVWDYAFHRAYNPATSKRLCQALPFKTTLYPQPPSKLYLPAPLASLPSEMAGAPSLKLVTTPDIYLFVVESLRGDAISPTIAPNLAAFKRENISFDRTLSNANGTHLSWFAIFHSELPFHWASVQKKGQKKGALPLRVLKEWGYEIHLITSSHLHYYRMDEVLFGNHHSLADTYTFFPHNVGATPAESDARTIETLIHALTSSQRERPRLFLIFLDSTHFDYSWPEADFSTFHPAAKRINYLKVSWTKSEIAEIKNRYFNALHYVDHLFGTFWEAFRRSAHKDRSIVVFTADHGEEFYEKGFLFHGSHLSREQTRVPLYFYFGKEVPLPSQSRPECVSHVDIFPTLLHILSGDEGASAPLFGESIFKEHRWPYTISTRYNGGRVPFEFAIQSGKRKLLLQYEKGAPLSSTKELSVVSLTDEDDREQKITAAAIKDHFAPALPKLLHR